MNAHPDGARTAGPALIVEGALWSCDLAALGAATRRISPHLSALHLDAGDGEMSGEPLLPPALLGALRPHLRCRVHVHLMARVGERLVMQWAEAGADAVTVHVEADDTGQVLHRLHQDAPQVARGIALTREVDVATVETYLEYTHLVLVVNTPPGAAEGPLDGYALDRVRELRERIDRRRLCRPLLVEGGVHADTVADLARAGASGVVAGSLLDVAAADVPARAAWIAAGGHGHPPALTQAPDPHPARPIQPSGPGGAGSAGPAGTGRWSS